MWEATIEFLRLLARAAMTPAPVTAGILGVKQKMGYHCLSLLSNIRDLQVVSWENTSELMDHLSGLDSFLRTAEEW